ncbi:FUSC family protein [Nocardioides sp. CER19]|uniref:FUSC family protein n=1 Tax=Nocardioides sp. CER19 TaxID=3038538 RepID=UPI0024481299|nr:FUSC family protein [Nocardioides sp. CER19]MDH2416283.1 FUSC family protein [Nocardioides sp. CER19]
MTRTPDAPAGVSWRWSYALRGLVTAAPAAAAAFSDVQLAAGLAVGLLPVCPLPLPPSRTGRLRLGVYGVLAAVSIFLGGVLAQWPVAAVAGMVLAGGALGYAVDRLARPATMLGVLLCLPLLAVGFSYPGTDTVSGLAADILLGSAWSLLVAVAWPTASTGPAAAGHAGAALPPPGVMVRYGWTAGSAGAVCAAIGFAADLEHVGWAPAAALLVMRPNPPVQEMRSFDRLADVAIGAAAAGLLVIVGPPTWVYAAAIALVGVAATATAGSRWYVLPTFTTFLVFVLLLARDPADAQERFWERVLETALGIAVAAVATFVVLPALTRRAAARSSSSPAADSDAGRRA